MQPESKLWTSGDAWIPLVHNIDNNFFFLGEMIEEQKRAIAHQVTDLTDKDNTIAQQEEAISRLSKL